MMGQAPHNEPKTKAKEEPTDVWVRKFDFDEEMMVGCVGDEKYFLDEDEELAELLDCNNSALQ